jgi:hypothetical protein
MTMIITQYIQYIYIILIEIESLVGVSNIGGPAILRPIASRQGNKQLLLGIKILTFY